MNKVVFTITAQDRTATIVYSYAKYVDKGTWQVGGDKKLAGVFDFFAGQPSMAYNRYAADTDMSKTYDHLAICAQMVADCSNGDLDIEGEIVFPPFDADPDLVY
jgi:hypothetical protein